MEMTRSRRKEGGSTEEPEWETYQELTTLNSMIPLWKKAKSELKAEDYNDFFKKKFGGWEDPLRYVHTAVEGTVTYNALLYVPAKAPFNFYSKDYEKGLQLYSNGVLIMDKCADLLPDYFSFVRGLVDSADLSLNISREMLQHDRHLQLIANAIEKKIKNELISMLKNKREDYEKFWQEFGLQIKYGAYQDYGMHKDKLVDLFLCHSSSENKLVTFDEYVSRMKEDQKNIYYACGETIAKIEALPQMEMLREKGYEVLCLTDSIDDFVMKMMNTYKEKTFKLISDGDLDLETEAEKEEVSRQIEENKPILDKLKEALSGKVSEVTLTGRLKSHPCCLSAKGMVSLEMEKLAARQPGSPELHAERVLELNASHPVFEKIKNADDEKVKKFAEVLYTQALLIEGMPVEDPVAYANAVCDLIV